MEKNTLLFYLEVSFHVALLIMNIQEIKDILRFFKFHFQVLKDCQSVCERARVSTCLTVECV